MFEINNEKLEHFRDILKNRLSDRRFYHSCMVSVEAKKLAEKYGADIKKAEFAGLVHDIEKDTPTENQLEKIAKYNIKLDDVESSAPKLLHAIAGFAVLKNEYEVTDEDILNAVRYHTTARANMSILEKIIYLADFISADRKYEGVEKLRKAVYTSLDCAMDTSLCFSITELLNKKVPVHLDTVRAWNEFCSSLKK